MSVIKRFIVLTGALLLLLSHTFADDYPTISWDNLLVQPDNIDARQNSEPVSPAMVQAYIEQQDKRLPNQALDGQKVTISGFVVPLEWDHDSKMSEFLLVPYYGACIHVPPPPKNQIIHVRLKTAQSGIQTMDFLTVLEIMTMEKNDTEYGESVYSLSADDVQQNLEGQNQAFLWAMLLTVVCAFSISLGLWLGLFVQQNSPLLMGLALSFSAGTMVYLSLAAFWIQKSFLSMGIFFLGFVTLVVVHFLLHLRPASKNGSTKGKLTVLAIIVHSIPEYFIVFSTAMMNIWLGSLLALTVICHNIPLGCALSLPELGSRRQQLYYALLSVLLPVTIAIFMYQFIRALLSVNNLIMISLFAGGLMFYVALKEILPTAGQFVRRRVVVSGFLIAIMAMSILTMVISIGG